MNSNGLILFSGNNCINLATEVAEKMGIELGKINFKRFKNGETITHPKETVRGKDVFFLTTFRSGFVNDDLMEAFIFANAAKRSGAKRIVLVASFLPYMRQDRETQKREPITARMLADLLKTAGYDHIITINLHSDQEQGFFSIICDNLSARSLFAQHLKDNTMTNPDKICIVSPDSGGFAKARNFANLFQMQVAVINKIRRPGEQQVEVFDIVNKEAIKDRTCILYDDMCDTGGTTVKGAEALISNGAKSVWLFATHPVFSDGAVDRLENSCIERIVVTNTIPAIESGKIKVLSIADILAKNIANVHNDESLIHAMVEADSN